MDEEKPLENLARPREVLYAVQLTFVSLAFSLVLLPLRRPDFWKPQVMILGIFAILMTLSFTGLLLFKIWRGHNWARLLYIILFFIGAPFAFPGLLAVFQKSPILAVIRLLQLSLQLMAVVLLLQKPTRDWFRMLKVRKLMQYQIT